MARNKITALLVADVGVEQDASAVGSVLREVGHTVVSQVTEHTLAGADVAFVVTADARGSGAALTAELRDKHRPLPIVLLSTRYTVPPGGAEYDVFIPQPFSHVEVLSTLEGLDQGTLAPTSTLDGQSMLPLRGNLQQTTYETLLYKCFTSRATGRLTVRHGKAVLEIFVLRGFPVWSRSNTFSEALGTLLIRRGLLTTQTLNEFLRKPSRLGVGLGQRLVTAGLITPEQLFETLDEQVRERVLLGFGLREGEFEFETGDEFAFEFELFLQNPVEILFHGAAHLEGVNALARRFQERASSYVIPTENFGRLLPLMDIDADTLEFAEQVDGSLRLSELIPHWMGELPQFFRFIWGLLSNRMVYTSPQPLAHPAVPIAGSRYAVLRAAGEQVLHKGVQVAAPAADRPPEAPAVTGQGFDVLEELVELHDFLEHLNHFDLFGLELDATPQEIRTAIQRRVNALAPDLIQRLPSSAVPRIAKVGRRIKEGAAVLLDDARREHYRADVLSSQAGDDRLDRLGEGMAHLESGDHASAQATFQSLVDENPVDARATALLARSLHLRDPSNRGNLNTAKALLHRAIAFDDGFVDAHYFLGAVELKLGNPGDAKGHIDRALELDPDHRDAKSVKEMLSGADGGTIRIIPGLFGK